MKKWMCYLPEKSRKTKIIVALIAVSAAVSAVLTVIFTVYGFKMAKKAADMGANVLESMKNAAVTGESSEARLIELQNLRDKNLITNEEYEAKRREILEEL